MNPLRDWRVDRDQITFVGQDLQRPECVLAEPDGTLWSADARGGVMRIDPDGTQQLIAQTVVQASGEARTRWPATSWRARSPTASPSTPTATSSSPTSAPTRSSG